MNMKNSLTSKTIIITGAGSGIGQATAQVLAEAGATIIAVGKSKKHLDETQTAIIASGGVCFSFIVNLENLEEIIKFSKTIKKRFSTIDWLINSAGYIEHEEKLKDFSAMFRVNTLAVIYLTRLLSPLLKERGGVINISSIAGIWGSSDSPVYAVSKVALNFYSKVTAQNFTQVKSNLSCHTICPGRTNTPMRQKIAGDAKLYQDPEVIGRVIKKVITGKSQFKNGDMVIVKDGQAKLYEAED